MDWEGAFSVTTSVGSSVRLEATNHYADAGKKLGSHALQGWVSRSLSSRGFLAATLHFSITRLLYNRNHVDLAGRKSRRFRMCMDIAPLGFYGLVSLSIF